VKIGPEERPMGPIRDPFRVEPRFIAGSAVMHAMLLLALLPGMAERAELAVALRPVEVEVIPQWVVPSSEAVEDTASATALIAPGPSPLPGAVRTPSAAAGGSAHTLPTINLGMEGAMEHLPAVMGDIAPPIPNAPRNLPPNYPAEAARLGIEGTVGLVLHISARGVPETVRVAISSGTDSLDRAAASRLRSWRFTPAMNGDIPVPFDYEINIRFVLGDHR